MPKTAGPRGAPSEAETAPWAKLTWLESGKEVILSASDVLRIINGLNVIKNTPGSYDEVPGEIQELIDKLR